MPPPAADPVVDWGALLDVTLAALAGGVGVTTVYAIFILSATRVVDLRRDGHALAATVFVVIAAIALALVVAAVALGIAVMTSKD